MVLGRLGFRHRIWMLVVVAAFGLVTVTTVTLLLGRQSELQLGDIETRYVPLIELDRDLGAIFAKIPRTLADAAAAAEDSGLAEADRLKRELVEHLRGGAATIAGNGADPRALELAFGAYYTTAREVSASLVAGTPLGELTDRIEAMRQAQQTFSEQLDAATTPDRSRIAAAFATARASQRGALWIEIAVAFSALSLMVLLSWRIVGRTVHALREVSEGVERLARGDFGHEIDVATHDELGELAREANRTAVRLREYRERTETLLAETRRQADELARASRYKSEFLANMSHELRTPLNSIMILSQVMASNEEGVLPDKQVELARVIHKSGEELLALVNEVLDLAKVEAGKQEMTFAPLPLRELEDYIRRMFQPLAIQKQLAFDVGCAHDELPAEITTDRSRLAQILKNLIANAFKFTERGRVAVRITRASADQLEISVTDTGIGIAADQQAWIFEAFAQAETGTTRKFGGTGLGLTIAKQLAVRLGGSLRVESERGHGSTFVLGLPLAAARSDEPPRHDPPAAAAQVAGAEGAEDEGEAVAIAASAGLLAGMTVLIADADMRTVYSLARALRAGQLQVATVADARDALDHLERHPEVDVVLIDSALPDLPAEDAIRRIRALEGSRLVPIIVLAAEWGADDRARYVAAGASDYLAKPVDVAQLLAALRTRLTAGS